MSLPSTHQFSDCLIYGLAPLDSRSHFSICGATRAQLCLLTLAGSVMHACGWYHSQWSFLYRQDGSDRYSVQPQNGPCRPQITWRTPMLHRGQTAGGRSQA